ncbi:hypothetical protein T4A_11122 [Trichinella pseudospiralis]|uniref:Uncharacterized protein n=1 Tax=Trichinella pseudospiralis TaxID=6337 RepID=A0A0V1E095_TRIPS|nr:hypothetical protein T4A_11122 [Trichinella pseudospiralis]
MHHSAMYLVIVSDMTAEIRKLCLELLPLSCGCESCNPPMFVFCSGIRALLISISTSVVIRNSCKAFMPSLTLSVLKFKTDSSSIPKINGIQLPRQPSNRRKPAKAVCAIL